MKKFGCLKFLGIMLAVTAVLIGIMIWGVNKMLDNILADKVLAELPKYEDSVVYESDDSTDYVNYTKYVFDDSITGKLGDSSYLRRVLKNDIDEITEHIEDFEKWIEKKNYAGYDFKKESIDDSDYCYIENNETFDGYSNLPEKLSAYSVYLFDSQSKTLYYFHYNI